MEEQKLCHEENEAVLGLFFHVFDRFMHGVGSFTASKRQSRAQHAHKCSNGDAEETESHASRCRGQISKLNEWVDLVTNLLANATVAEACQEGTLGRHGVEGGRPIVQLLLPDVE
jgi:hypothetical protein